MHTHTQTDSIVRTRRDRNKKLQIMQFITHDVFFLMDVIKSFNFFPWQQNSTLQPLLGIKPCTQITMQNYNQFDNWFLSVWCAITICWCFWFIIYVIGQLWIVCNDALYFWICYLFLAAPNATVQNSFRNKNLDASESCEIMKLSFGPCRSIWIHAEILSFLN